MKVQCNAQPLPWTEFLWPRTKYFLVFDNDTENVIDIVSVVGDNFDGYILSYENKFKFLDEDEEKDE